MVRLPAVKTAFLIAFWAAAIGHAYASEADALAISSNIQTRHLPFGTILDPIFASSTSSQIVGYTRCGDSAIWTGHYLAAEAFRYQVTRAPEALADVKNAIAGIQSLVDVTGTDLLARCLVPANSPFAAGIQSEEAHNGIHANAAAGAIWVGNTSRDEYAGVMFGLGVAYDMVSDPDVQGSISQLVTRLVDFLRVHAWLVVMPDGSISTTFLGRADQILSFLQVARHVNPGHFSSLFNEQSLLLSAALLIPIGIDVASDDSYFKFNLDSICFYNLIRLDGSPASKAYRQAYDLLRFHTAPHQNAFFNMIDRGLTGPNAARDAQTLALLDAWLERPRRDVPVDLHGVVPVCGDQACQPVPVSMRPPADFLWQRSPFQLVSAGKGVIENAGIDYILPYWMARYYSAAIFTVQSAASAITTVAPGSIASIYGANLAAAAVMAGAQPWPQSLGSVSLSVRDASGAARAASLLYVSPGQINFVVPAGTQPGTAAFTVTSGATSLSAPGPVLEVAPSLFSANVSGRGVAAATAMRGQSSVPVFSCSASGCVVTPIDLGSDTPVFLTLYGTGIRNRSSLSNVTVTIHGVSVPVLLAGPQPDFDGVDQVKVALVSSLRGSGETNIVLVVDGQTANTVTVSVR